MLTSPQINSSILQNAVHWFSYECRTVRSHTHR
ncbi:hypothetical protein M2298_004993 [Brevibacillus sp. 1238]|nr:hypothetical protein [Brevibacillus sp. 1238]